jgi:hypothetical protein
MASATGRNTGADSPWLLPRSFREICQQDISQVLWCGAPGLDKKAAFDNDPVSRMTEPSWKQNEVFPIIERLIRDEFQHLQRFVTTHEIAKRLLEDAEARALIVAAQEQQQHWTTQHLAVNMVAWFSQRITSGESEWRPAFDRTKIDGKWAYKPTE